MVATNIIFVVLVHYGPPLLDFTRNIGNNIFTVVNFSKEVVLLNRRDIILTRILYAAPEEALQNE